jgi:hypothetical protein
MSSQDWIEERRDQELREHYIRRRHQWDATQQSFLYKGELVSVADIAMINTKIAQLAETYTYWISMNNENPTEFNQSMMDIAKNDFYRMLVKQT